MLQHYYSQISELFDDYKAEYSRDLEFFTHRAREVTGKKDEQEDEQKDAVFEVAKEDQEFREQSEKWFSEDDPESSKKSEAPEWARKLFKKIALMTHPDRISDDDLRENLQKSFLRASRALEEGKFDDLVGVAVELSIDAGLEDEALIPLLKAKIHSCRQDIHKIECTDEWQWGESLDSPPLRCQLLEAILSSRGFSLTQKQISQLLSDYGRQ